MSEVKKRKPLEAEYVHAANSAALEALGDVDKRRSWGDSKYGSPVTTNLLCAEIARLQIEAHHSVPALLKSNAALVKALEEAKAKIEILTGELGLCVRQRDNASRGMELLESENSALKELILQYRSDLLRPPASDSRDRRIKAIDAALAASGGKQ